VHGRDGVHRDVLRDLSQRDGDACNHPGYKVMRQERSAATRNMEVAELIGVMPAVATMDGAAGITS
jgi:hypothetical protein